VHRTDLPELDRLSVRNRGHAATLQAIAAQIRPEVRAKSAMYFMTPHMLVYS
jgi:hypothetical protein